MSHRAKNVPLLQDVARGNLLGCRVSKLTMLSSHVAFFRYLQMGVGSVRVVLFQLKERSS